MPSRSPGRCVSASLRPSSASVSARAVAEPAPEAGRQVAGDWRNGPGPRGARNTLRNGARERPYLSGFASSFRTASSAHAKASFVGRLTPPSRNKASIKTSSLKYSSRALRDCGVSAESAAGWKASIKSGPSPNRPPRQFRGPLPASQLRPSLSTKRQRPPTRDLVLTMQSS